MLKINKQVLFTLNMCFFAISSLVFNWIWIEAPRTLKAIAMTGTLISIGTYWFFVKNEKFVGSVFFAMSVILLAIYFY